MLTCKKNELYTETAHHGAMLRFGNGVHKIIRTPAEWVGIIAYLLGIAVVGCVVLRRMNNAGAFATHLVTTMTALYIAAAILGLVAFIISRGTPHHARKIENNLARIGFTNAAGEVPILLQSYWHRTESGRTVQVLEFLACGLAKSVWENKQVEIAAALNVQVAKIEECDGKRRIRLYVVPADNGLPDRLDWHDDLMNHEYPVCKVILGESLLEPVVVDFNVIPHMLVGGGTGSGKTVLLRCILMQLLRKSGVEVVIADLKGGADFSSVWRNHPHCKMIFDRAELAEYLDKLVEELNRRKEIIAQTDGCCNIYDYNNRCALYLDRIFFAVDEVAEILDKTGLDKAEKEQVARIERSLSTIARLGRAFGIQLLLATQRPDANILSGQIKNNIAYRVCGRADNVLSMIILDNTDAANQIPSDARGRFINGDGTVFQGYWFNESILED